MRLLLGFLLFTAWALIGRYYYVCEIKNLCGWYEQEQVGTIDSLATEDSRLANLFLQFEDEMIAEGHDQFLFKHNIAQPSLNENNEAFLGKIFEALKLDDKYKNNDLKITGRYLESESDAKYNDDENLGIARAKAVAQQLIGIGLEEERISFDSEMIEGDALTEPISFKIIEKAISE